MAPPPSRGGMGLEGATGDKIGSSRLLLSFQSGHARVNVHAVFGETWSEPRAGKKNRLKRPEGPLAPLGRWLSAGRVGNSLFPGLE